MDLLCFNLRALCDVFEFTSLKSARRLDHAGGGGGAGGRGGSDIVTWDMRFFVVFVIL
jgi:hypothetical protein